MYCLNMLAIAIELPDGDPVYEDIANKSWQHFLYIADAMRTAAVTTKSGLWDEPRRVLLRRPAVAQRAGRTVEDPVDRRPDSRRLPSKRSNRRNSRT